MLLHKCLNTIYIYIYNWPTFTQSNPLTCSKNQPFLHYNSLPPSYNSLLHIRIHFLPPLTIHFSILQSTSYPLLQFTSPSYNSLLHITIDISPSYNLHFPLFTCHPNTWHLPTRVTTYTFSLLLIRKSSSCGGSSGFLFPPSDPLPCNNHNICWVGR